MGSKEAVLGVDTSNYTTSLALIDPQGNILARAEQLLTVKKGEKGLRQSDALFQHVKNLPDLSEKLFSQCKEYKIVAVCASETPRDAEGSYMPVFRAGTGFARSLAAAMDIPVFFCSHQRGHFLAAAHKTELEGEENFLAWHLSGGTCELLKVTKDSIQIIGGSKDISFGQLLDRAGVALGADFPAGKHLDQIALSQEVQSKAGLSKIPCDGLFFNLSGLETQFLRACDEALTGLLFFRMAECLFDISSKAAELVDCKNILFSGGVSASRYLRENLGKRFPGKQIRAVFGAPDLSADNAVGAALWGGRMFWR